MICIAFYSKNKYIYKISLNKLLNSDFKIIVIIISKLLFSENPSLDELEKAF